MFVSALLPTPDRQDTSYPAGRVRKMMARIRAAIVEALADGEPLAIPPGRMVVKSELLSGLDALSAEFAKLDGLLVQVEVQRQTVTRMLPTCVQLFNDLSNGLQLLSKEQRAIAQRHGVGERKPRRKATTGEKLLAAAKLRETRRLRGTMSKRQKRRLKAGRLSVTLDPKPK